MKASVGIIAVAVASAASMAVAQGENTVGSVGLTFGFNYAEEVDGSSPDTATVPFGVLSGDVAIPFENGFTLGFEGNYRHDNFRSSVDLDDSEDPESQYSLTLHLLRDMGEVSRAGFFANYGYALAQDRDADDAYDYFMIGAEGQTFLADNLLVFGQAGLGDKVSAGQDSDEGFNNGAAFRAGLVFFNDNENAWIATIEHARSANYIDSSDPGRHFSVTLGAERRLGTSSPLFMEYGITYDHLSSTDEGEQMDEIQAWLGVKYVFGADTPRDRWTNGIAHGSPRLPVRASAWTEWMD